MAVSQRFRAAIVAAHTIHTYVEWRPWYSPTWQPLEALPQRVIVDGSATLTRTSLVRRTASLSLAGLDCLPEADLSGPISPHNRYRLWRGVAYPDGTTEDVLLGTFMVARWAPTIDESGPTVALDLSDEMKHASLDTFPAPLNVSQYCRVDDLLRWILTDTDGWEQAAANGLVSYSDRDASGNLNAGLTPTFTDPRTDTPMKPPPVWVTDGPLAVEDPDAVLGTDSVFEGSRLAAVEAIANAANLAVYLDAYGNPVVTRRAVDIDTALWTEDTLAAAGHIAWTFDGGDGGSLGELGHEWSIDDMVNEVSLGSGAWGKRYTVTTGPLAPANLGMTLRYTEDASSQPFGADVPSLERYGRRLSREKLGAARKRSVASLVVPFLEPDNFLLVSNYGQTGRALLILDDTTVPLGADEFMAVTTSSMDLEDFLT